VTAAYHTIDLARLALAPGGGTRIELGVAPGWLELAGQRYDPVRPVVDARVDVSRTSTGHVFRLCFAAELSGPCMRCLEPARVPVEVDAREIYQPGSADEDLRSPYVSVSGDELDVATWAHDALALAVPVRLLCRPDCAGLCPVCGVSLNDAGPEEHRHDPEPDPRWAKLGELELE
jgi:uncharacterized protein